MEHIELEVELMQLLTPEQAWHYHIIPKASQNGTLAFYADESNFDESLCDELEILFGKQIDIHKVSSQVLNKTLARYYRRNDLSKKQKEHLSYKENADDFIINLIREAQQLGSSDIHIEPYEERCRVRMRIDGQLVERFAIEKEDYSGFINKIKILSNLDIAEKRLPQDGRIYFEQAGDKLDIRVSILPTLHGEKVVLRLLSNDATNIDIYELGFSEADLNNYLEGVRKPHGIILISGPTGSGKTTTLYATLKLLNKETRNILTIEDPIEYTLEGINQVQLKESIGLTFARALRTFLRQDPDVIMLGEIRDAETASMAIRASLTGHLVFSTIHTNSAWGTISRLSDMGIQPFLIASTMNVTMAQRLVRLLCPDCKKEEAFGNNILPAGYEASAEIKTHFVPQGCDACYYTGYKGRKAIFEVIPIDAELAQNIKNGEFNVSKKLKERGIVSLADNAFDLFLKGESSLEEIYPLLLNY